uniref:Transposase MuDR plant domain-containing protein n=1 Tax=Lactuca sativa TaxID=4236 RepID=A0A9R1WE98_LACSA|nr:hypothetical protein LSAT_V11C200088080 [Lactuca sativa]
MDANIILDILQNKDFHSISQVAVASNAIAIDNEVAANDVLEEDEIGEDGTREEYDEESFEVPSTFTTMEEKNMITDSNWIVSQLASKNDFTQEVINLYSIRTHKEFDVVETCLTLWTKRCKLHLQFGCKWKVHAIKLKRSRYF